MSANASVRVFPRTIAQEFDLLEVFQEVMAEEGIRGNAFSEYTTEEYLEKLGIHQLPAITINGTVKVQGRMPTKEEIVAWLRAEVPKEERAPCMTEKHKIWPRTVNEAVKLIMGLLTEEDKAAITQMGDSEFVLENSMGWGQGIRNSFGLFSGNNELLKDCGTKDPDEASSVIMRAVSDHIKGL